MAEENPKCLYGGVLVGTIFPLPDDPKAYYKDEKEVIKTPKGSFTVIGCNRLYCSDCNSFVKNWVGYRLDPEALVKGKDKFAGTTPQFKNKEDLQKVYDTENPLKQPLFTKEYAGDQFRIYACRCAVFETTAVYHLSSGDWADIDNWLCAGHAQK